MAFPIPPLDLDAPMKLNPFGKAEFCERNQEAFWASFSLHINASAADEWEVTEIYMGTQRVTGELRRRFAQYFEDAKGQDIADHVAEHIGDAKTQAAYDAREFMTA